MRRRLARRLFPVCAGLLVLAGCRSAAPPPEPPPARLVLVNLSSRAWHLSATAEGRAPLAWRIAAREQVVVDLPAGRYQVTQRLEGPGGGSRDVSVDVLAGEHYTWPLATTTLAPPAAPEP